MLVNTFVNITVIRNSLSVSVFKNKLEMFHSKKDFLQHVQV